MRKYCISIIGLLLTYPLYAFDEVIITPADPKGWSTANVRDDAVVEINNINPLFGDGSLMFITDTQTNGQDKADFEFIWQQSLVNIDHPNRTLGNITRLSYAWYRSSESTTADHLIPVFRVYFYDDNNTPTDFNDDVTGFLIWEGVYNGFASPVNNSWEWVDLFDDNFWVFVSSNPQGNTGVIQNFNVSLDEWINNSPNGQPGDPQISLSASTWILGVNVGVGSGWGNTFTGFVDAVRLGFGPIDDVLYNFEFCQPPTQVINSDVIFTNGFECFQ